MLLGKRDSIMSTGTCVTRKKLIINTLHASWLVNNDLSITTPFQTHFSNIIYIAIFMILCTLYTRHMENSLKCKTEDVLLVYTYYLIVFTLFNSLNNYLNEKKNLCTNTLHIGEKDEAHTKTRQTR